MTAEQIHERSTPEERTAEANWRALQTDARMKGARLGLIKGKK